ncbi:hypothetical protein GGI04_000876 [Coemansia thaxteri]|uniref:RBR-type E3 ubiquitin transferase n=1 Tax=Coemansia thaxteri TaxID=2663907 RepID=A0A9W8BGQ6_9FUNG|nr:hypothetical protein H4R26_001340 [Coemansia thaxteri]KAJ2008913.1 hypothetical protein GGI04_000876 [Coemansia thaxteri]KAJ2473529.1 hypothetical protein GGI02_000784 [Coemansia sp. RSA 2322]KAJ2487916.1 hypothetical protein EV174_000263 [Coemansia sp. RSA 2320]
MDYPATDCADQQQCEMDALAAIYACSSDGLYDEQEQPFAYSVDATTAQFTGRVDIEVDAAVCEALISAANNDGGSNDRSKLVFLPPIQLRFELPTLYPLDEAPRISLTCCWLTAEALETILKRMDAIWRAEQGMCVLDSYINSIRYDLLLPTPGSPQIQINTDSFDTVIAYSAKRRQSLFGLHTYSCMICLEQQSGKHCAELSCSHVFCLSCLRAYWEMLVDEGRVWLVRCPHTDCTSLSTAPLAAPEEVARVLRPAHAQRLAELSEQRRVDMDSSQLAWCPRDGCGQWGRRDAQQDRLCVCDSCAYAFCVLCRRVWHGASRCAMASRLAVLTEYRTAVENNDSGAVAALERRYGKTVLERMLEEFRCEEASEQAVRAMTQACPTCGVRIIKAHGCNHMRCTQCDTHFCYLCGECVDRDLPLNHFNSVGSSCHMLLLEGVLGDEGDEEGGS